MIVGNALWQLVAQSDGMTKGVLLLLLAMSKGIQDKEELKKRALFCVPLG